MNPAQLRQRVAIGAILASLLVLLVPPRFLDQPFQDGLLVLLHGERDPRNVVVLIDDRTMEEHGLDGQSLPRATQARALGALVPSNAGASHVLLLDRVYTALKPGDDDLKAALLDHRTAMIWHPETERLRPEHPDACLPVLVPRSTMTLPRPTAKKPSLNLLSAAARLGHAWSGHRHADVVRHVPMVVEVDGCAVPSLALSTLLAYRDQSFTDASWTRSSVSLAAANGHPALHIPLDAQGRTWFVPLDYPEFGLGLQSMADLLEDPGFGQRLYEAHGSVLISVGAADQFGGVRDMTSTVLDEQVPGVWVWVSLLDAFLQGRLVAPTTFGFDLLLAALLAVASIVATIRVRERRVWVVLSLVLAAVVVTLAATVTPRLLAGTYWLPRPGALTAAAVLPALIYGTWFRRRARTRNAPNPTEASPSAERT